jgi:hypothetical protein
MESITRVDHLGKHRGRPSARPTVMVAGDVRTQWILAFRDRRSRRGDVPFRPYRPLCSWNSTGLGSRITARRSS